jgi:major histocompatibility complex class I
MRYFHTAMSRPGQAEPWYLEVCYVDDTQIVRFDSEAESPGRGGWSGSGRSTGSGTRESQSNAQALRRNLRAALSYYNQSKVGECPQARVGDHPSTLSTVGRVLSRVPMSEDHS